MFQDLEFKHGSGAVNSWEGQSKCGGAITVVGISPDFINCTFRDCSAYKGGAIYSYGSSSSEFLDCRFEGNNASYGGVLHVYNGSPEKTFTNCAFESNTSQYGAVFSLDGNSRIRVNSSLMQGNGPYPDSNSQSAGGVLYVSGNAGGAVFKDSELKDNWTIGDGGAICMYSNSTCLLLNSNMTGNYAIDQGGAIYSSSSGLVQIVNSKVQSNSAFEGGGIYLTSNADLYVVGSLFSDNQSPVGSAIYASPGTLARLSTTVVCENEQPQILWDWLDAGGNQVSSVCGIGACCVDTASGCVQSDQAECELFGGTFLGYGIDCSGANCPLPCIGDVTGDRQIDVNDILLVLSQFGVTCP